MPRVSVVIPVRDDAALLARCLRALAAQQRPADEIIVVDNDSSDASAAVARAAGARVVTCTTPGVAAASAAGYDAATGDLILRLDADCVPGTSWVADLEEALGADPRCAAVTGSAHFVDGPRWLRRPLAAVYLGAYFATATSALAHPPVFGSNLGMRASAWRRVSEEVHREDGQVHDDFDLAFHLGREHRIRRVRHTRMGMSMRPFRSIRSLSTRFRRGMHTVIVHWPHEAPPVRWRRRLRATRGRHQMSGGRPANERG